MQFTRKTRKSFQFLFSKFTSINIHCKQRCSFQAFKHILEIVTDHDLQFIRLLKTNSFFNFTFFEHGTKVKQYYIENVKKHAKSCLCASSNLIIMIVENEKQNIECMMGNNRKCVKKINN